MIIVVVFIKRDNEYIEEAGDNALLLLRLYVVVGFFVIDRSIAAALSFFARGDCVMTRRLLLSFAVLLFWIRPSVRRSSFASTWHAQKHQP